MSCCGARAMRGPEQQHGQKDQRMNGVTARPDHLISYFPQSLEQVAGDSFTHWLHTPSPQKPQSTGQL